MLRRELKGNVTITNRFQLTGCHFNTEDIKPSYVIKTCSSFKSVIKIMALQRTVSSH